MDVNELRTKLRMNVQVKKRTLRTFVINPLFHISQKKKMALEIAVKFASVNGPQNTKNSSPFNVKTNFHYDCVYATCKLRF